MMLKQSVWLFGLLWACGLNFSPRMALASEQDVTPNNSSNSVTQPINASPWSVTQPTNASPNSIHKPTRLEISLSRRKVTLYYGITRLKSYPIAVGRPGWETPKGYFRVVQMLRNPTWIHPMTGESIQGGDPENPLGKFWIGFWTDGRNWIGFHGTPTPKSVGTAASHGCIRMYNKDVEELFSQISVGLPVSVVP